MKQLETYTGGREMLAVEFPDFMRPRKITVADVTPGTKEYESREAFIRAMEDQYLWELEREENEKLKAALLNTVKIFGAIMGLVAIVMVGIIALGYYIGA